MANTDIGRYQWAGMVPRLEQLCHNRALSAGDIAAMLNDEFQLAVPLTRHAVIGKVYRLGLRRPEAGKIKIPLPGNALTMDDVKRAKDYLAKQLPPELGLSIMDLTGMSCRWPIAGTGADMRYCGAAEASLPAVPYCREHARMAYNAKG